MRIFYIESRLDRLSKTNVRQPSPPASPVTVAKFSQSDDAQNDRTSGSVVGGLLVCQGSVLIFYAQRRYEDVARRLEAGGYRINTGGLNIILGMIVCTAVGGLIIIAATG